MLSNLDDPIKKKTLADGPTKATTTPAPKKESTVVGKIDR